jgi:predicted DNA-binding transcriptional regulator AlpA
MDNDDALITRFLGRQFTGRRYLRYAELRTLGLVDNRSSLTNWMKAGAFPRGLRIPGRSGKTLVWQAVEIARHIALRAQEANEV